ncbi:uncharacterized protein RHIMIDRAFT_278131 [Rhizopus microsporus ATCC 52813]|uniref:Uncharacterized protein n=1 Tax=Rhizopus microsporus ATCC 52813 TaxID=1340429 RepID=A0A2G4SZA1_RHIZD|nr:uncharacterized protein RHIMIDRAFT_278131 [Rhizopus microsporus ATCC 52813]PHZ14077.1 hypothetical protein RHIMIDRAFT_278131 [Rhizopus microsporus ATCC 52813]
MHQVFAQKYPKQSCNWPKKCPENKINFEDISQVVSLLSVPNMLKTLGPYEEIDAKVISLLNTDFRITQKKLYLIPKLFTGALIHNKLMLMAITCEACSRHATIDIHLETSIDSVPSSKCFYMGYLVLLLLALMERTSQKTAYWLTYNERPHYLSHNNGNIRITKSVCWSSS